MLTVCRSRHVQEMNGRDRDWSISTGDGVSLGFEELVNVWRDIIVVSSTRGWGSLRRNGPTNGAARSGRCMTPCGTWLSEVESTSATVERFAAASTSHRARISDRFASGDDARERTVCGTAHWTVNVAYVLRDSWLHERDVLLPLGRPAPSSEEKERLVGPYGLLMALVSSMRFEQPISSTVQLSGLGRRTVEVTQWPIERPGGTGLLAAFFKTRADER